MRQIDVAGLNLRGDGSSADLLRAARLDWLDPRDFLAQHVNGGSAVGRVLDEALVNERPTRRSLVVQVPGAAPAQHSVQRMGEGPLPSLLIDQEPVGALTAPSLAYSVIRRRGALKRQVPRV